MGAIDNSAALLAVRARRRLRRLMSGRRVPTQRAAAAITRGEVARLEGRGTPSAQLLAQALDAAIAHRFDHAERHCIEQIEAARARMLASTEQVSWSGGSSELRRVARLASQPRSGGELLFSVVRRFRPEHGLELGTCVGVSAAYQAAAMRLNGTGRLVTLEAFPDLAAAAGTMWDDLGLGNVTSVVGRFEHTLPTTEGPVDYAFIDGHHDGAATLEYFARVAALARPGAVVVLDDIAWSEGMAQAWRSVSRDARVAEFATTGRVGIVVLSGSHPAGASSDAS